VQNYSNNTTASVIFAKVKSWATNSGKSSISYRSRSAEKTKVVTSLRLTSPVIAGKQKRILGGFLKPKDNALFTWVIESPELRSHSESKAN